MHHQLVAAARPSGGSPYAWPLKTKGSCPYISEMEVLKLIAEIEDKSLEQLQETTMRSLRASSTSSPPMPWTTSLGVYVDTGVRGNALAAMMDPSFPLS